MYVEFDFKIEIKLNYYNIFITFNIIKRSNNKSQL